MTTTMSLAAMEAKEERLKMILVGCLFAAAIAVSLAAWWLGQVPPEPNYSGYYEGPWVNKNGELVSADGVILRQAHRESQRDDTAPL